MAYNNITPIKIGQIAMVTTYSVLYTTPANSRVFVKDINIMNTTAAAIGIYVSFVPDGESPNGDNSLFYNVQLPAYTAVQWTGSQILLPKDTIQVKASAVGCTIIISGGEAV
jgi:hypothetical protein